MSQSIVGVPSLANLVIEREEDGLTILSPANGEVTRRVLFVNLAGEATSWKRFRAGLIPANRFWGCIELAAMGYEVGMLEALPDFYLHRNPFPHDLKFLKRIRTWLKPDDILYCGHNTLYWLPFLKRLGLVRCQIVSMLYAREPLDFSRSHRGIIALNPAAAEHAKKLAPNAKVAHLSWGMDLNFLPRLPYQAESFLSCGRTQRDHRTLSISAAKCSAPIRLISPHVPPELTWSANVEIIQGGKEWETKLTYGDLLNDHYSRTTGSLIIIKPDPIQYTACGFTNLLEAMAMARPVILTRTSALQTEIDVEQAGCGLQVPPEDPEALADAINALANNPDRAKKMGEVGRRLCETHYNTERYGIELHKFFESL